MVSAESSSSLKDQGNGYFTAGNYERALNFYTQALDEQPDDAVLFSNRAACHLKLGQAAQALADADEAVRLRPDWAKGHFRRGCALELQGRLGEVAGADSSELRTRLKQLRRELNAQTQAQAGTSQQGGRPASPWAGRHSPHGGHRSSRQNVMNVRMQTADEFTPHHAPDSWAQGLSPAQQREWLVDCYRMRVDDDMVYGLHGLHGLYAPEATGQDVAEDFLVFCKLAVRRGVVPRRWWSWPAFLRTAAGLLPYAFEKADAKEKWGGENVFSAMFGGRSLRATAGEVMGSSCMGYDEADSEGHQEAMELYDQVQGQLQELLAVAGGSVGGAAAGSGASSGPAGLMFEDVGGAAAWSELLAALNPAVARAGHWG